MNKPISGIVLFLILALLISCGAKKESGDFERNNPSDSVEQATFVDLEGDSVNIADYKGKVVMIDFWETWCKPCLASFPTLEKLQGEYPEDFVVLAVTPGFTDTPKDAQTFVGNHDYTFEFLMDSQGLHKELGVQGIPFKVFVDAEGNFIKSSMGSYGSDDDYKKIKKIIEKHRSSNLGTEES